ncbi:MAG: molybdopterin molybdenumtransferase MoeA [Planctomycetota bacterium]|nr:MAG: molybdopterin molybdenumtransferase MoeA [Planctomycetota bacterium]
MLSVEEALQQVQARANTRPPAARPVRESLGLLLAEDVTSDVDSPPHDKSMVDGFAVHSSDLTGGTAELEVLEEVMAGDVPHRAVTQGTAVRVMTGAPIPEGADAVVMVEQSEWIPGQGSLGRVRLNLERLRPGQHIMPRATSMSKGQRVLSSGHLLRSIELGVLAEVGRAEVSVVPRPTLAVLATGNELVPPLVIPSAGHIRNSNGQMLVAAARSAGAAAVDLGIARDDVEELRKLIAFGLESDILVVSGGVSAGVLDLVPGVLQSLGVEQVFHKIRLKPGKPLWFGVRSDPAGDKLVFGAPGNPVSSLVCFELFVRPAIASLAGRGWPEMPEVPAALQNDHLQRGDRPSYLPARVQNVDGQMTVELVRWHGSGDLLGLVEANALAHFPPGERTFAAGETVGVLPLAQQVPWTW